MAEEKEPIEWLALAQAERAQYRHSRDVQWKVNVAVWALLAAALYTGYTTEVVEPLESWICWAFRTLIVLYAVWCIAQQKELEETRARWSYYQGFADDTYTEEMVGSIWRVRALAEIVAQVGVTATLAASACMLFRAPPFH